MLEDMTKWEWLELVGLVCFSRELINIPGKPRCLQAKAMVFYASHRWLIQLDQSCNCPLACSGQSQSSWLTASHAIWHAAEDRSNYTVWVEELRSQVEGHSVYLTICPESSFWKASNVWLFMRLRGSCSTTRPLVHVGAPGLGTGGKHWAFWERCTTKGWVMSSLIMPASAFVKLQQNGNGHWRWYLISRWSCCLQMWLPMGRFWALVKKPADGRNLFSCWAKLRSMLWKPMWLLTTQPLVLVAKRQNMTMHWPCWTRLPRAP